jgi:hypothetical protein
MDSVFGFSVPPKLQPTTVLWGEPVSYQQLTVSGTAVALTVPNNANKAMIMLETDDIRWRDDGTAPSSTVGMYLYTGSTLQLNSLTSLNNFRAIRVNGDATLNISYYRQ